jgi:hypothetical protein
MAPLNSEQARLNRARMILYVKQFGPIRSLFSAKVCRLLVCVWRVACDMLHQTGM